MFNEKQNSNQSAEIIQIYVNVQWFEYNSIYVWRDPVSVLVMLYPQYHDTIYYINIWSI